MTSLRLRRSLAGAASTASSLSSYFGKAEARKLRSFATLVPGQDSSVVYGAAAMTTAAVANTANKTVTFGGAVYNIQDLGDDSYTVLNAGIPVGRIVLSFGAANGVPEGDAISEDDLTLIGEAWFEAVG
jgi:hypothetical protein